MTDDHDSPDPLDPEPIGDRSPFGPRRFARLVQSHTVRRLSPKRMLIGSILAGLIFWAIYEVGTWVKSSVGRWVASRPEHQIFFSDIELIPQPPPYIRSGTSVILANVRAEAKYGETVPILDTDLEALRVALSRNPWIEEAESVRTSYRHLAIQVVYRKPLALVISDSPKDQPAVIDRNGVELPSRPFELEWAERELRPRGAGCPNPLFEIRKLGKGEPNRVGYTWETSDPNIDADRVVQAAQIAEFLDGHRSEKTPKGRQMPDFQRIYYHHEGKVIGFFLQDADFNFVFWDSAPGREAINEPAATEKWAMLMRHLDAQGSLGLNNNAQEFLLFNSSKAFVKRFKATGAAKNLDPTRPSRD